MLAQKDSAAQRAAAPQVTQLAMYAPEDAGVDPSMMPSLLAPFRVRDSTGAFHTIDPAMCCSVETLMMAEWWHRNGTFE